MIWRLPQIAYGFLMIAGLLAVVALCFYVIWGIVMIAVSFVPIVGKRHRHDRWDELNATNLRPTGSNRNQRV